MKTYIAIPSCRDWKPHFGASLCGLVRKMTQDGTDFIINAMMGTSVLPRARQMAMEHAIELGYTHILFLDDDMGFDDTLFERLNSGLSIVAANYSNKSPARNPQCHGLDGNPLSSVGKTGVEEVGWVGFGAILIDLSCMKDIPKPWFETRWVPERNAFIGEDYFFCGLVRSRGQKIYINHEISCSHIGDYPFKEAQ